ncbi:phosphatidylglycerol lysyltransferase domain-containing protein [Williamwhitmania taraxaci]|uniref:Phosphatidylglycerol lysyltransferase n=1 Tax=Williamwhitmania taraxaci TaxID=1640674 RepID=A0A1G6QNJ9_9BACT|nr:phosphatidylglycerol lysyltransferase domain-containing protein [Williamwhitmania taraxaci]SDC93237.1 phosphatidylglycerol lysyltransferase [Williamwhitmania taraxaci]
MNYLLRLTKNTKSGRFSYLLENRKLIAQFILAVLFVGVGVWFFKHERSELGEVRNVLGASKWQYLSLGVFLTAVYITLQGLMYKFAFASLRDRVLLSSTILLFLKRNFISIFIPAGGVASLAFFSGDIEKRGVAKSKIHFASSIYAFVGILSIVLVAIPIFTYAMIDGLAGSGEWFALAAMIILISTLYLSYRSITRKGYIYRILTRFFPTIEVFLDDLISHTIESKYIMVTILMSILIDVTGIAHLYIAMLALGLPTSLIVAMLVYLTAVISLSVSPFMRGLGAVEVSMTYILTRFGFSSIDAVALTFLYRFFEFWLPLFLGALSFLLRINKLLMRIIPAVLLFALGIINIISVLTPAIADRMQHLQNFLPIEAITVSNYFVLLAGIFMLLTAAFLFRGLRSAWWLALFLGIISCVGHLTKAIDYEESIVALLVVLILLYSRKEYYVKNNPQLRNVGIMTAVFSMVAVMIYGTVGFYYLDKNHFNIDFNLLQSVRYTIQNFFLVGSSDLVPNNPFAKHFLLSINVSGFISLSFFFYTLVKPYVFKDIFEPDGIERAKQLVFKYGSSSLDYFKTYNDKVIFELEGLNAFIAYRVSGKYAVVLENPVAENIEQFGLCISMFDKYCYENGLKSLYYRVSEENLSVYRVMKKKALFLGQEGIVDLHTFTLEGRSQKALRNAINKVLDRGYKSTIHTAPLKDGLLQRLQAVSDEWLKDNDRTEIVFSQGMFSWSELKQQTVITVEGPEEKVVAFLNIIPDYAANEATYDLIRKTADAPGGVIDYLMVELFNHIKSQNIQFLNLGFAPMSGIDSPQNLTEQSMKFAYQKIKSFAHYKGLREYKEKFSPIWTNKYLVYDHDFDLLQAPLALAKVIKP